jgi:hypothetical protein
VNRPRDRVGTLHISIHQRYSNKDSTHSNSLGRAFSILNALVTHDTTHLTSISPHITAAQTTQSNPTKTQQKMGLPTSLSERSLYGPKTTLQVLGAFFLLLAIATLVNFPKIYPSTVLFATLPRLVLGIFLVLIVYHPGFEDFRLDMGLDNAKSAKQTVTIDETRKGKMRKEKERRVAFTGI